MPLKLKRKLAIGGAVVAAAGVAGGAYAASSSSTNPRRAFIDDVAKRLNVSPTALDNALKGAYQDQLNQAVKSGKLTQAQANRIKQRIAQRRPAPIGFAHRGFFGHRAGIRARGLEAAAKYLGLTDAQLLTQLRSGKSLAEIATAQHKSVSGLTSTLKADVKARLDKAVAAKMLTSTQEQKLLSRLDQRLNALVNRKGLGHGMMHRGFGPGGPGGPGGLGGSGGLGGPGGVLPPGAPGP
jgi:Spy/CpxP family protein refolding chaperone